MSSLRLFARSNSGPANRLSRHRPLPGLLLAAVLAAGLATPDAHAQAWPSRTIQLIVPLGAGSTGDIIGRVLAQDLTTRLGQSVVIENNASAGGQIALSKAARATPDGHTLALITSATHGANPSLYKSLQYDPIKDFIPVAPVAAAYNVLCVPVSSPLKTYEELVAFGKSKPDKLSYSSGGSGTTHHLSGALFGHMAGIDMLHVPYRGAAAGVIAVMAGEVDIGFFNSPSVLPFIKDGKLRALGVTSLGRLDFLPEVASMDEHGLKGYQIDVWFGVAAPVGTPADVVERVRLAIDAAVQDPEVQKKLDPQGARIMKRMSTAEFNGFVKDEIDRWTSIVKISGATVQ